MVATRDLKELAVRLLVEIFAKYRLDSDQLSIHADRSFSVASEAVAFMLVDLGVTKSHSHPDVSDNGSINSSPPAGSDSRNDRRLGCLRVHLPTRLVGDDQTAGLTGIDLIKSWPY